MQETFRLGHLAGIRVGVHWSVLVIFALIAFGLAQVRLPGVYPDRALWLYWSVGLVTAVVFFASLLAHELAHAIVARRNGVRVEGITLWLLGGVARLQDEAASPSAELRISGVGPLVSFLVGLGFGVVAVAIGWVIGPGLVLEAAAWLAAINILLAIFNVIPAAPLDGGRLLRAFLWWRTGDRVRATLGASTAGRIFGWTLVVLGLFLFLQGVALSGIWLAIIGFFLISAATAEGRHAEMRGVLAGIPVREAMTPDPVTAPAETTIAEFLDGPLFRYRHSAFPVTRDGTLPLGMVCIHQIRNVPVGARSTTTLGDIMRPRDEIVTTSPDEPLTEVLTRMESGPDQRALVLDGESVVGILTPSDISRVVTWLTTVRAHARGRNHEEGRSG
ncbi:site-2 protease family protein [Nocardiopsis rhodophaea]|uniref:site-2 protease family protein n=1 Tax=Nocardiopsis rhodophaea TaxID=280238 RepID=UPI0031D72503